MFCISCPKKPFCSALCPEAETYARQDQTARREFFSFPEASYTSRSEEITPIPALSKTEWKIATLLKKDLSRAEVCAILELSRPNLRNFLLKMKRKGYAFKPISD